MGLQPREVPKAGHPLGGTMPNIGKVGGGVYHVQLPPRGLKVVLHRDRLAPYRDTTTQQLTSLQDISQVDSSQGSEKSLNSHNPQGHPKSSSPVRFRDFVLGVEYFSKRGVVFRMMLCC